MRISGRIEGWDLEIERSPKVLYHVCRGFGAEG